MANGRIQVRVQRPIWNRKIDLFYVVFLSTVTFLAFAIDFVPLYPARSPSFVSTVYEFYRTNLNDPLYHRDPPFFQFYVALEAVYAIPTCLWAIRGLIIDDPTAAIHLLGFATHLVSSTGVCLVEVLAAKDWPKADIDKNIPGYVIFGTISIILWMDMFFRLKLALLSKDKVN
ncbi:transmembrane protein 6/97 [Xylariales sp. AK1849]|nr:transmembrane protein 6/97 [Xylariales sp. AK1849]